MRRLKSLRMLSHPQSSSARFWQSLEYPRATATAGEPEQGKEALRIEGIQDVALAQTDLSSRQLAAWITVNKGFSVSESTVYRILMCQGLVKSPEMKMAAGKEFQPRPLVLTRCGPLTLPTSESVDGACATWSQ